MSVSGNPDFNSLPEEEKRLVAERVQRIKESGWKPFWCPIPTCSGDPHPLRGPLGNPLVATDLTALGERPHGDYDEALGGWPLHDPAWAHNHARVDQRLPPWNQPWTLLVLSGRGAGKTRMGVEFVTLCARKGLTGAILGRRGTELVNTHVKEILANAHPEFMPVHWASKDLLEWPEVTLPDGTKTTPITYLFSAEKPENIRSVNLSYGWVDEAAFMDEIETAWMNLKMATRIRVGDNPIHFLITSTPTPTKWVMDKEDEANDDETNVILRRVSTYANRANLDPDVLADMEKQYEGTRMGRQELHGEVLRDVEGALWTDDLFSYEHFTDPARFDEYLDSLDDIVVAVDPAGSANKRSDETGIVAVGAHHFDEDDQPLPASQMSVLADGTLKGTTSQWCERVYAVARRVKARRIIAEKNFGGDMVKQVLTDYAKLNEAEALDPATGEPFLVEVVHAVQGKESRAEVAVGKYEQKRVKHVVSSGSGGNIYGDLSQMEKEQCTWIPRSRGGRSPSPNRVDAVVWGIREVDSSRKFGTKVADGASVWKKIKRPGPGGYAA